jgi:uncharacterized protein YecE (DUF72 family)
MQSVALAKERPASRSRSPAATPTVRVGVSGWRYTPWRGVFYPEGLPQSRELWFAARSFQAVELNGSFYSLQRPEYFEQWYRDTPADFVFAVKGPRFITHMKRLKDSETPLANFFASGVFKLREKLGPILWQLPPTFRYEHDRLANFLRMLPTTTARALSCARRRDYRLKGRACLSIDADRPLRHAIEIRHPSFCDPGFIELLRECNVALVVAETAGKFPLMDAVTADFMYLRLHGDQELYRSGYSDRALKRWAARIQAWRQAGSREIFCFFDNTDVKLRAPFDARKLMQFLGLPVPIVPQMETRARRATKQRPRRSVPKQ